jgi:uncharacterized repeat protein (TIGR01451 family)
VKLASITLAAFLQIGPMGRRGKCNQFSPRPRTTIIFAWITGAIGLLGNYDAVSGASAAVSGLVKYVGSTPVGTPTNYVQEPIGEPFKYRITVTNPGTDVANNYFNCIPLPPGLTINTNPGAAGYITGTPSATGRYSVTLLAGNLNYPTPATLPATILIYRPNAPPLITNQPVNKSVPVGTNVTFTVGADGTPPLTYEWLRNSVILAGRTGAVLRITNVVSSDAGNYQAIVANAFGRATSAVARLTIREPFLLQLRLADPTLSNNVFRFQVTGPINTNYVVSRSTDLTNWFALQTNWVVDGILQFADTNAPPSSSQFYRASVSP